MHRGAKRVTAFMSVCLNTKEDINIHHKIPGVWPSNTFGVKDHTRCALPYGRITRSAIKFPRQVYKLDARG